MNNFENNPNSTSKHTWGLLDNCKTEAKKVFEQALYNYKSNNGKSYEGLTKSGENYGKAQNYNTEEY